MFEISPSSRRGALKQFLMDPQSSSNNRCHFGNDFVQFTHPMARFKNQQPRVGGNLSRKFPIFPISCTLCILESEKKQSDNDFVQFIHPMAGLKNFSSSERSKKWKFQEKPEQPTLATFCAIDTPNGFCPLLGKLTVIEYCAIHAFHGIFEKSMLHVRC